MLLTTTGGKAHPWDEGVRQSSMFQSISGRNAVHCFPLERTRQHHAEQAYAQEK